MARDGRKLGKGLGALLPAKERIPADAAEAAPHAGATLEVPVESIQPNPDQPREHFDADRLRELAESIRAQGVLQPLLVRRRDNGYELVAGERRLRAATIAELRTVPVVVTDAADDRLLEMALVENVQREDLNILEIAVAYQRLCEEFALTHDQVSRRVGVSRVQVSNTLRLLQLAPEVQEFVLRGALRAGHAKVLLGLCSVKEQVELARRIEREDLSVRETERLVRQQLGNEAETSSGKAPQRAVAREEDATLQHYEDRLRERFGTKVRIDQRDGAGNVVIEYYSPADLGRILEMLGLDFDEEF
jgi:ParB family chromosome partitioning protein